MNVMFLHKDNDKGFVLVTAVLILMVLTFIGIIASKTTVTELMVAGNDKVHKQTFYQADGGTELAQHVVYHNSLCNTSSGGFTTNATFGGNPVAVIEGSVMVEDVTFADTNSGVVDDISDTTREAAYYPGAVIDDNQQHTNFKTTSVSQVNPGSGLQMVSGYDGLGAGAAGGGASRVYTIASQHHGAANSQSLIQVRWRLDSFVVSSAAPSDCDY